MSLHGEPPPLAPDDDPFDYDHAPPKPLSQRPGWIIASIVIILALIAGLISPVIDLW